MPFGPLETKFFLNKLRPGDLILFRRKGFFDWLIEHVTNAPVTHTEVYAGNAQTYASRNGEGVNTYLLDLEGIACILRPASFDAAKAAAYQARVIGQGYDWTGLWRAFVSNQWGRNSTKQWCSEHSTNILRAAGVEPFEAHVPADMTAPGDLLRSAAFTRVWAAKDFPL